MVSTVGLGQVSLMLEPMHTEPWSFVLEEAQASAVVETGSPRAIAGLCELKQLYNVSGISTVKAKER